MDRFVSTFTNKIDAKGRVSVPAAFRAVLERDGYAGGIYCYPSLDAPALDAGGERLAQKIDGLLAGLPDYSDERDELSVALYGDVQILAIDGDGRIVLPQSLRAHADIAGQVTFVGLGVKFQIWQPERFQERRARAREKVHEHRRLLGAGGNRPDLVGKLDLAEKVVMEEHGSDGRPRPERRTAWGRRFEGASSRATSGSAWSSRGSGRRALH